MLKCLPLWQNNSQKEHLMPDLLILSGKNLVYFLYLSQKLRFRISHLLLERVYYFGDCWRFETCTEVILTLEMTWSAQVVEASVTNNSSFQNFPHPGDHTIRATAYPWAQTISYDVIDHRSYMHSISGCQIIAWNRSGARFSKAPESFRARKAIFRTSVSKNGEVCSHETSCMKGTSRHL